MIRISGMSGNEIFCLDRKGFEPGEIAVGNSVVSLGVTGALGSLGRSIAGGEVTQITELISEGRHRAIERMEKESRNDGALGVTGVESTLGSMAGYAEFLAQGTGVHPIPGRSVPVGEFFSTAASGIELYSHLETGYMPRRFVMGNVAYALGLGRGIAGTVRTLARGEVKEFSSMFNEIRRTCLLRLRTEAANAGANAVVDVDVRMIPFGPGTIELLMTGTASMHAHVAPTKVAPSGVVTSELSGEEVWNLADLGYVPHQIVMATSVYSLGMAAGLGTMMKAIGRGELPEVTKLVYEAREVCLDLVRKEAEAIGAVRVIGNRLQIREIGSGLIEIVALGTAVRSGSAATRPSSRELIPQAIIADPASQTHEASIEGLASWSAPQHTTHGVQQTGSQLVALLIVVFMFSLVCMVSALGLFLSSQGG